MGGNLSAPERPTKKGGSRRKRLSTFKAGIPVWIKGEGQEKKFLKADHKVSNETAPGVGGGGGASRTSLRTETYTYSYGKLIVYHYQLSTRVGN